MTSDPRDDKLDLSPLDPQADRAHWEAMVQAITRRAMLSRDRREEPGLWFGLMQLMRPAFGLALGLTVVVWSGALLTRQREPATESQDPTLSLLSWAAADSMPDPAELLATFGGSHDPRR